MICDDEARTLRDRDRKKITDHRPSVRRCLHVAQVSRQFRVEFSLPYFKHYLAQVCFADIAVYTRHFLTPFHAAVDTVTIDWTYTATRGKPVDVRAFVTVLMGHPEIGLDIVCDNLFEPRRFRTLSGKTFTPRHVRMKRLPKPTTTNIRHLLNQLRAAPLTASQKILSTKWSRSFFTRLQAPS